ncbi:MAG: hypothetical protein K6U03_04055, partial [Firmicutes bacterium]|nr:hypothetical protein [Bacillota bacterium]
KWIDLEIHIAGRVFTESFPPEANLSHTFTWDGKDAYSRKVQGECQALIRIGYVYDAVYYNPQGEIDNSFGSFSALPIAGSQARQEITMWEDYRTPVGVWEARAHGLGGWTLDAQHFYEPGGKVLYLGDGSRRSAENISLVADTVAGTGEWGYGGDGGQAREAVLYCPMGITLGPDGTIYIADTNNHVIRRIGTDGIITTIAGTGEPGYGGDGGPATEALLDWPSDVAVGPDGSIYVAEFYNHCLRRIAPDGIITIVAGTGAPGYSGDGGPAIEARLYFPTAVDVGPDGSIYLTDRGNHRLRRVGPDGIITTVAGTGMAGYSGDGGPAAEAELNSPMGVAAGPDGSIYFTDYANHSLRRIAPDGIITTVAGTGTAGYNGDGGPASATMLAWPARVAVGPQGKVYITDTYNSLIRRISLSLPDFTWDELAIPSEDGGRLYRFDPRGKHLATIDSLTGAIIHAFHYDEKGLLVGIEDADGNLTTIERDSLGNPTAVVGPYGQRTALTLNADGYLQSITNPAGERVNLRYTPDGLLTELVDPRGGLHLFAYNGLGRLVRDEDPAGGVTILEREEFGNGYVVTMRKKVDARSELVTTYKVENLPTGETRMTNAGCCGGPIVSVVSLDGTTTIIHPDGTVTTTVYGPDPRFGMQAPIVAKMTVETPGGLVYEQEAYRDAVLAEPGNPLSIESLSDYTTINGRIYTTTYEASTRCTMSSTSEGRESFTYLDEKGRIIRTGVPGLAPVSFEYDERGRLVTITEGEGLEARVSRLEYNAEGYVARTIDPMGRVTSFEYDAAGRVVTEILPDGRRIPYTYDAHGNVTSITPPGRPAHTFTYTPVDLEETYNPPPVAGGGTNQTRYDYNLNRQLIQITRPDGQTIGFAYDTMGRPVTVSTPEGEIGYVYDATSGNLTDIIAVDGGALSYTYDGSLLTGVRWQGRITGSVGYEYDNDFRVKALKVNGTKLVDYGYDRDGLLFRAGSLTLTRDSANGLLLGTQLGNVTDDYTYNAFGEMTDYVARSQGAELYRVHQEMDGLGRITRKVETVLGETHTYEYGYDQAGRLVDVYKDGVLISHYDYDPNGNRLAHVTPNGTSYGTYDDQDRMLSYGDAIYEYTANGELLRKTDTQGTTHYTYDVLGNLTSVVLADGTRIEYIVDGQNRRIGKKVNGVLVQGFLYQDALEPIAELDGAGNVVARFVYASRSHVPDYMIKNGVTYRIISDHLGSVRLVVDVATGQIVQRMEYDEFGNVILDTNPGFQPFGFAGGIYDPQTGLVRFGARDYDAKIGRWTAKDRIRFGGGMNQYKYAGNDPINYIDPSGLLDKPLKLMSCPELAKLIKEARNELADRYEKMINDRKYRNLYNTRRTGEDSWEGHQRQFEGWQKRLRELLKEFEKKGCGNDPNSASRIPEDAWKWATVPVPERPWGSFEDTIGVECLIAAFGGAAALIKASWAATAGAVAKVVETVLKKAA